MLITIVAGARPNFIKIAPIIKSIEARREENDQIEYRLVHTGQHYDRAMSGDFFEQLQIPQPHINLEAGGGTQAEQTGAIMVRFEKELNEYRPTVLLVVGDVTSTMACTITAKKMCIEVVHVEAGIRSGDMTMPEEVNRMVTDSISDHFFTTSEAANTNLRNSGIEEDRIHFVGNTMIDTLYQNITRIRQPDIWKEHGLKEKKYFLVTLHRPSNVDDHRTLSHLLDAIIDESDDYFIVFPVHPRTKKNIDSKYTKVSKLILTDPFGYLEFMYLVKNAKVVITDSGGITEEATVLDVPCLTLRNSTERPETVTMGSNELVGTDPANLSPYLRSIKNHQWKKATVPPFWDGKTSDRIVQVLHSIYSVRS